MVDYLDSSGDLSELSTADVDDFVVTPTCPICHKNYSNRVEPVVIHPCGHGVCAECMDALEDNVTDGNFPLCPLCRQPALSNGPNYDLREVTSNVSPYERCGFWEKQICNMRKLQGRKISFAREMRLYAKAICVRLSYDDVFVNIKTSVYEWTREERQAVVALKNALVRAALQSDDTIETLSKWVNVLSVTVIVETHLMRFFLKWYETKEFLNEIGGTWLLDVLTHPV